LDFFYNQVINDDIYRDYLLSLNANEERIVSKPWDPSHDVFDPVWDYKPELCFNREDGLSICESGYEWICFMEKWANNCLMNPFIEVFRTIEMGVGLRCKVPVEFPM